VLAFFEKEKERKKEKVIKSTGNQKRRQRQSIQSILSKTFFTFVLLK